MPDQLYASFTTSLLNASAPDLSNVVLKLVLVDAEEYVFDANHTSLSDIPSAGRIATTEALTGVGITNGGLSAANPLLPAVSGDVFEFLVLYIEGADEASSQLVQFFSSQGSFIPNGGNIELTLPNGFLFEL